jgi:chromosome segregation ATPase
MAEYRVKVNSSNFIEILSGQQKFLILTAAREPVVGDILIITDRSDNDNSVEAVITSFDIEANGIENGFVVVSIDINSKEQSAVVKQSQIDKKIVLLNEKISELTKKYNASCNNYNELDNEKTKINELLKKEIKKSDGMQEEISSLKAEISKQKNELARNHNTIKDLQFHINKQRNSLEECQARHNKLADLNASLSHELQSIKNKNDIMNNATEHVVSDSYIKLKSLTKNLLSYIDSNL